MHVESSSINYHKKFQLSQKTLACKSQNITIEIKALELHKLVGD